MFEYEKEVKDLLSDLLALQKEKVEKIDSKKDLQYYGLDSLNCIQLIVALEESFGIQIQEEKIGLKYVRNIYDICLLIREVKQNERI